MKLELKKIRQQLQGMTPPSVVTLDRYCSDADDEMDTFLECLQKCQTVERMSFGTDFLMRMDDETVLKFFTSLGRLSTLTQLSIQSSSRFHIESIPVAGLLQLRNTVNLHTLELHDMQVTAEQKPFLFALAKTLENHGSLKTVRAPNFFANDYTNTSDDILDPFINSLSTIPNIEELELTGCGSHAMSGQNVTLVSRHALQELIVQASTTLRSLQLSFLEFNDDYFDGIVTALASSSTKKTKSSLHTLIFDYHDLGSDGFRRMMTAMEENDTIKALSLRSLRDIGCDGFAQAMKMLQFNYTIETLSVTTTPSEQAEIDLYLRMNSAGRRLLRDQKVSLHEWVEILARHSDDIDVTRHLIQQVPGLCNVNGHDHDHKQKSNHDMESDHRRRGSSSPITTMVGLTQM